MPNADLPFVSVIVPVYNDLARLRKCVEALRRQTYPRESYEIIVVDNGSLEPHVPAAAELSPARVLVEPVPGSYAARNRGLELARGPVVGFTDADCVPAEDWIAQGVRRLLSEPRCGLVGGKVEVNFRDPGHPTIFEIYDQLVWGFPQEEYVERRHFAATANAFTFKRLFDEVGPFNAAVKSSGDHEWGNRVYAKGYRVLYAAQARVAHPARGSFAEICRKEIRLEGGRDDNKRMSGASLFTRAYGLAALLKPPVGLGFRLMNGTGWLSTADKRLKFLGLACVMRFVKAGEKIRLLTGGISRRG